MASGSATKLLIAQSHPFFLSSPLTSFQDFSISHKKRSSFSRPRLIKSEMSFSIGTHLIPHPAKMEKGGEDAFFVSSYNGGVLAIADGVSGWAEKNVDPALFSRELMENASDLVTDEEVNYDPQILMRKAHAATSSIGSATIIISMLETGGTLKIASVGDCGLRVLRNGQVIFSTQPQEHYFDCPYQLSSEIISQTYRDAMVCSVDLKEGDTVVMGSDGLFDNMFDQEIISTIYRFEDVTSAAQGLADLASNHSKDVNFDSPYSMEARSRGFDVPLWKKILGKKLTGMTDFIAFLVFLNFSYE